MFIEVQNCILHSERWSCESLDFTQSRISRELTILTILASQKLASWIYKW